MSEIRIETTFGHGIIRQTMHGHGCVEDQIIQSVIKLKDDGVRKALIELGWSPPVATPVPDYTGEGSAWAPPDPESQYVAVDKNELALLRESFFHTRRTFLLNPDLRGKGILNARQTQILKELEGLALRKGWVVA